MVPEFQECEETEETINISGLSAERVVCATPHFAFQEDLFDYCRVLCCLKPTTNYKNSCLALRVSTFVERL